jgi:hypothetical protein
MRYLSKEERNKQVKRHLKELKREIVAAQKWHNKTYDEVLVLINEMKLDPTKRAAKKILTRLNWLDHSQDLGESLVGNFEKNDWDGGD